MSGFRYLLWYWPIHEIWLNVALFPTSVKRSAFVFKTGQQQILLRKFFRLGWHFRFQSERCW